jgi:RecB family exonuclease
MAIYNPVRTRNLFKQGLPFSFSRSKVESFIKCPRCFYLDRVHGIAHPPGFPFTLNSAVDTLLKREFDYYRNLQQPHPLVLQQGFDLIPFAHEQLNTWRENFKGARTEYGGYEFFGAIDDVWISNTGELVIVDYKATAAHEPVKALNKDFHDAYKRQMEFYQWIFRQNGFKVSDTGIFVYCTGDNTLASFDASLNFRIKLISYTGSDSWVAPKLNELISSVESGQLLSSSDDCEYCKYFNAYNQLITNL